MLQKGRDDKYLETINPLIESGHMQATVDGVYKYPHRINLFVGISCMFRCFFCGRNYDAHYKKSPQVYETFKQVIDQDDGTDPYRLNISGGQEPLTNPYINQICKDLYDGGYKSRLLTNFFMANPKWLSKNEWINSLDHIRVSLYGLDEDEMIATTKHSKSYKTVKSNLRYYNQRQEKTNLYLNYVLHPSNYTKLSKLICFIEDIGGIEHLSLREDFAFNHEIMERNKLQDYLCRFDERANEIGLKVDYGYSLHQLINGYDTRLIRAELKHLTAKQSPQIKIAVDPKGDIYYYQEAAFLDRLGAERHILGNIVGSSIENELKKMKTIEPQESDIEYMDAFNHVIEVYKWNMLHS